MTPLEIEMERLGPEIARFIEAEQCFGIKQTFEVLAVNRDAGYAMVRSGVLPTVMIHKVRKVQWKALLAYLDAAQVPFDDIRQEAALGAA